MTTSAASRSRRLVVTCLLGVIVSLVAYVLFLTEAWAYLSDDPYACANCHSMEGPVDSWAASSHRITAGCNDCHAPRSMALRQVHQAVNGIRHGWSFTFGSDELPRRLRAGSSRVLEDNCVRCHAALLPAMLGSEGSGEPPCTRCHRTTGHG